MTSILLFLAGLLITAAPLAAQQSSRAGTAAPLSIGQTFTINSRVLGETRRINVYAPPIYSDSPAVRLPVLYMPDGGIHEDFLHIAGLVQISVANGTMRPFLLIGIENTQRRRDLTGPTSNPEDRKIAPKVGESAAFRRFLRTELMPVVNARYRTTGEKAIMGESLAGLFVVETLLVEPDLFDSYIAFDPSLWWNNTALVKQSAERLRSLSPRRHSLYLANSNEPQIAADTRAFAGLLKTNAPATLRWQHHELPEESHGTIYHPAALKALRTLFAPPSR